MTQNNIRNNVQKPYKKLKILGLTGGIAAGKSLVSAFLKKKQGYIFDCDKIAHLVILKGNTAYNEIISAVPGNYVDDKGAIDRRLLGGIVFNDKEKLRLLEAIIHRHVINHIFSSIEKIEKSGKYKFIVIDAPLLIEAGLHKKCDIVWVIEADFNIRAERLMHRNGFSRETAEMRINAQTNWDTLDKSGFVVINNSGSVAELKKKLNSELKTLRACSMPLMEN